MADTIFALSSGTPPAGIAVIRVSGPGAGGALQRLAGRLPAPRRAVVASLRANSGDLLDRAVVLWLPGPATVTGEDVVELHCHGGRAVIAAILEALAAQPGLRAAAPGEFTRRAFVNGRIDLAEAEGLADLLAAETELQRCAALAMAGGGFSRVVNGWRERLLAASAQLEAGLDFADEDDVAAPPNFVEDLVALHTDIAGWLDRPRAEVLRDGYRVVIAGPPNAGKSTLFNALVEDDAAITAPIAGTTRDVLTRPVALQGLPFVFVDTAGLHEGTGDVIEAIGMERARGAVAGADLVLWLGPQNDGPSGCWEIEAQIDRADRLHKDFARHRVSALKGDGLTILRDDMVATARDSLPKSGAVALNARQHGLLTDAVAALAQADGCRDPLLMAEELRRARLSFDALLGRTATDDMLDTLFRRFCIGK